MPYNVIWLVVAAVAATSALSGLPPSGCSEKGLYRPMTDTPQPTHDAPLGPRRLRRWAVLGVLVVLAVVALAASMIQQQTKDVTADGMTRTPPPTDLPGVVSHHGKDYSKGSPDGLRFTVCDMEPDNNAVKGVYRTSDGGGELEDLGGADNRCASITTNRPILVHRTCERNLIGWDCDNQADNELQRQSD